MGNNKSAELLDKYETALGAVESIGYEISRGYTHSLLVALVKDMQNGKATATDGAVSKALAYLNETQVMLAKVIADIEDTAKKEDNT